ncbi:MAG: beta-ketoacyl-ACP reductase [Dehalococcoidia bacterium]|nr:beta-ketoacyl-ACP reductase [Dehalococcoidia bacterium]MCA9850782.1 beta-ketoacyl-ACP reductase [Dehalococcoidia bacterium]MCA9857630.1 beta-ketoacyl-ACP reductase [Dehalococcoidia bacterium]MCB9482875.1 beta-ketoacyl-ACP reductase [Dehalococcoidia bacterium]MCB9491491.1 beta-ketoacyl-ACP reductase [Dehalococcoidia bacterium]
MAGALSGQVAVVTGGSRGIGRACAIALANEGADVVINYTSNDEAAKATAAECEKAGVKTLVVKADVSKADEAQNLVKQAEETFGKVDILINNAGINRDKTIQRMTPGEWDEVIETDLSSIFYLTNAALGGMRERNYGRIVNMSSVIGQMGNIGQANYSAAKAGMIAFTKTAAKELARFGVTVNAVCPGFIETDMVAALSDEIKEALIKQIPLGRFGTAEEVADTVVFICKPSGAWYTGAQFSMNGGQYMS